MIPAMKYKVYMPKMFVRRLNNCTRSIDLHKGMITIISTIILFLVSRLHNHLNE